MSLWRQIQWLNYALKLFNARSLKTLGIEWFGPQNMLYDISFPVEEWKGQMAIPNLFIYVQIMIGIIIRKMRFYCLKKMTNLTIHFLQTVILLLLDILMSFAKTNILAHFFFFWIMLYSYFKCLQNFNQVRMFFK